MAKVRKTRTARTLAGVSAIALGLTGALAASGAAFAAQGVNGTPPGNTDTDVTGSLTIHKYEGLETSTEGNGGTQTVPGTYAALGGVDFSIQRVGTWDGTECVALDLRDSAAWDEVPTGKNPAAPVTESPQEGDLCAYESVIEVTTGADGSITEADLELGLYYVVETDASGAYKMVNGESVPVAVVNGVNPFYVTIPYPNEDEGWIYNVQVYPKNQSSEAPQKTVEDPSGVLIGSTVKWTITAVIPETDEEITQASIYDQFDPTILEYVSSKVTVEGVTDPFFDDTDSENVVDTNANVNIPGLNPSAEGGTLEPSISWDFTTAGLDLVNADGAASLKGKTITVELTTKVLSVPVNGEVDNEPGLPGHGYGSIFNKTPNAGETTPVTYWGALKVTKVDDTPAPNAKPLKGAEFAVTAAPETGGCPAASETVPAADDIVAKGASDANGVVQWVPNPQTDPETAATSPLTLWVATDPDGKTLEQSDLTKDYCVYETKPPAGYVAAGVSTATIVPGGLASGGDVTVINVPTEGPKLPLTGAAGTALLIAGGLGLVAIAFGSHMVIRNRQKRDA